MNEPPLRFFFECDGGGVRDTLLLLTDLRSFASSTNLTPSEFGDVAREEEEEGEAEEEVDEEEDEEEGCTAMAGDESEDVSEGRSTEELRAEAMAEG